jgi:hypothetical protein
MKTNGEIIRESNESLAKFIREVIDNCTKGYCLDCELKSDCLNPINYLNKEHIE